MKHSLWKLAFSAALLGASVSSYAGADVGQWTLGAGGMWTGTDSDRGLDDGEGLYYSLGKVLNEKWDFNLNGFSGNHDQPGTTWDHEIKGLTADFARVFRRDSRLSPYLLFGAGVVDQTGSELGKEVAAKLGLGATADLINFSGGSKLQLKGDVAARGSAGRGIIDAVANLGLQLAFGGKKAEPVVAAAAAPPPPPPPPAAPPPPPPPPPLPPPPPADDDRDGVVNTADRCPATPAGEKVDSVGCAFQVRLQVLFETNSARLTPDSYPQLDRVVEFLTSINPTVSGVVEGHTDSSGADDYNLKLSQQRADAVRQYMVDKGVSGSRITAKGYGETQPVGDNATAEGRALNRRVVFKRNDATQ